MIYQGSKARFAKYIIPAINEILHKNKIDTFVDACCGGCNIIANKNIPITAEKKIAYDKNKYLIALLNKFKHDIPDFQEISADEYKNVRINKQNYEDWYVGYVGVFATYGGGFFTGYGREAKGSRVAKCYRSIMRQQKYFTDIHFQVQDLFDLDTTNAVIYLDPPYQGKRYYTTKHFDYQRFWDKARALAKNNIVLVSEQTLPNDLQYEILFDKATTTMWNQKTCTVRREYLIRLNP